MRVVPPQSPTGWPGAQFRAGLAAAISGHEGIGWVVVPAPTHRHAVGLRGPPGHTGGGLGLEGSEGTRSPEQAVGGATAAVAREGEGGTAAKQAYKKGEKVGETQPRTGFCRGGEGAWEDPGDTSCPPRVWPAGWRAQAGPEWERTTPRNMVSKLPLLGQTYHILDSMSEVFLSCDPDFQTLLREKGVVTRSPCLVDPQLLP